MYIIYNKDGSIKKVKLTDFINQGSDGVNKINVAIDDFDLTGVTAHVQWTLPNGENIGPLPLESGVPFDDDTGDHYEHCFVVSIDEPETLFEGLLKGSLVLIDAQTRILYTYPIKLVINPSTFVPSSSTNITTEQYAALVEYIETNYVKGYTKTETNALLADKVDKVGPLPSYSLLPSVLINTFLTNNDLFNKPFVFSIFPISYLAFFRNVGLLTVTFEIEVIGSATRYQGTVASSGFLSLTFGDVLSSAYKQDYEVQNNKVTSLSANSTNNEYPSAKATYNFVKKNATKLYEHIIYIPEWVGHIHIINNSNEPIPSDELYRANLQNSFISRTKVINMYFENYLYNGRYYVAQFINDGAGVGFNYGTIAYISLNNMTVVKLTQPPTSSQPEVINEI